MGTIPSGFEPNPKRMTVQEIQAAVRFLEDTLSHQIPTKTYGVASEVFKQMGMQINEGQEGMQILRATANSIMTKENGIRDFKEVVMIFISDSHKRNNAQFHACLHAFRQLKMPVDTMVAETIAENQTIRTNSNEIIQVYKQVKPAMGPQFGQYLVLSLCQYEDANAAIAALLTHMLQEGVKNLLSVKEPREVVMSKRIHERKNLPEKTEEFLKKLDPKFDLNTISKLSDKQAMQHLLKKLGDEKAYRLYIHFIIEESLGIL